MTRIFIALEMRQEMQSDLEETLSQAAHLLPGIHWVQAASIHLTLAFLGELDTPRLAEAAEAVRQTALHTHPFSYSLKDIGIFGSESHPRVIWVGISESDGFLLRLHRSLYDHLGVCGFELDPRPFAPHLTLARVKAPLSGAEQQQLRRLRSTSRFVKTYSYPASLLQVMKSDLSSAGARYTSLLTFPFADVHQE